MLQNAGSLCSFGVQNAYWQTPLAGWGRKEGWIGRLLKAALCMQCIGEMCAHVTWPDTFNVYALHNYDNRKRLRTSTSSRKFVSRCALCGVCVFFFFVHLLLLLFSIFVFWIERIDSAVAWCNIHVCITVSACVWITTTDAHLAQRINWWINVPREYCLLVRLYVYNTRIYWRLYMLNVSVFIPYWYSLWPIARYGMSCWFLSPYLLLFFFLCYCWCCWCCCLLRCVCAIRYFFRFAVCSFVRWEMCSASICTFVVCRVPSWSMKHTLRLRLRTANIKKLYLYMGRSLSCSPILLSFLSRWSSWRLPLSFIFSLQTSHLFLPY